MYTRYLTSLFVHRERGLLRKYASQNLAKFEAAWCRNLQISPIFPACFSFREKVYYMWFSGERYDLVSLSTLRPIPTYFASQNSSSPTVITAN